LAAEANNAGIHGARPVYPLFALVQPQERRACQDALPTPIATTQDFLSRHSVAPFQTKTGTGKHAPGPLACLLGGIAPSQPRTCTTPAPRLARLIAPLSRIELRLAGCYECLLTGEPWVGNHWQDEMYLVYAHWYRPRISCFRRNPCGFGSLCIVPIHLHPNRIFDAFNLIAATFARAVAGV
jgi:hypothetical protein